MSRREIEGSLEPRRASPPPSVLARRGSRPHRFGGVEFRLGRRELGHLHGDRLVDLPFPRAVRVELIAAGRARPHHTLPDSGWITFPIRDEQDVDRAIDLSAGPSGTERASRAVSPGTARMAAVTDGGGA